MGVAGAFSFHPRKAITTGEGGMVVTDDDTLAESVRTLRNHGATASALQREQGPRPYLLPEFDVLGYNYRMTDIQAAVGLVQLGKLDRFVEERRRMAAFYERELASVSWLRTPKVPDGFGHCWQSYVLLVDGARAPLGRDAMMDALQGRGVGTRPGTHAVHMLGVYRRMVGLAPEDCPRARDCERDSIAIPLHNRMTDEDAAYVVEALRSLG
jgi:dTDP-4-amino-4,6-dideoxygalactose transaminase